MAEVIFKEEEVIEGEKARWPYTSDYAEPSKTGYSFEGWKYNGRIYNKSEYQNEQNNPFGPINGDTTISAMWDRMLIKADVNHRLISGDGDTAPDLTKITGWLTGNSGRVIGDGVGIYDVPLESGKSPIQFRTISSGIDNATHKFYVIKEAQANDTNQSKYYKFRAETNNYGGMESNIIEIEQIGREQILLPDFDYLTFRYEWTPNDGTDLDTATFVVGTQIPIGTNKRLDDYPVGYACNGSRIDTDYNTGQTDDTRALFAEVSQYIKGGGDNLQSGNESALIRLKNVCDRDLVSQGIDKIYCELYANWYKLRGNGNCKVYFTTYATESGTGDMQLDRDSRTNKSLFTFSPTGDTQIVSQVSISGNVYASSNFNHPNGALTDGIYSHVATLEYDIRSKSAKLINKMDVQSGRNVKCRTVVAGTTDEVEGAINSLDGYANFNFTLQPNDLSRQDYNISEIKVFINGVAHDLYLNQTNEQIEDSMQYEGGDGQGGWIELDEDRTSRTDGHITRISLRPTQANTLGVDRKMTLELGTTSYDSIDFSVKIIITQNG